MFFEKIKDRLSFVRIPNLIFVIVVVSSFVYIFDFFTAAQNSEYFLSSILMFDRALIFKGQIFRVLTFVFTPFYGSLFFVLFQAYFLYFLGTSLEVNLGERKFSLFYLSGVLGAIVVGFLTGYTTTMFLNMSMFFVFAAMYPQRKMLVFFVLPVKTIWLGVLDSIYFLGVILFSLFRKDFSTALTAAAAIGNFLMFFGPNFFIDMFCSVKNLQEKNKRMYRSGSFWED